MLFTSFFPPSYLQCLDSKANEELYCRTFHILLVAMVPVKSTLCTLKPHRNLNFRVSRCMPFSKKVFYLYIRYFSNCWHRTVRRDERLEF